MSFTPRWLLGIFRERPERLIGAIIGVALTITLLAVLGAYLDSSAATMTGRAIADVPVDWQILLSTTADHNEVESALGSTTPVTALQEVDYADVAGFSANTGGTVQTTGAGKVLGISDTFSRDYPQLIRQLTGTGEGAVLAQQTAANLHASIGDIVLIDRVGLPAVEVKVNGVVDVPFADTLFQAIGAPAGTAPSAPPDNVLIVPQKTWHALFDSQLVQRPDTVKVQLYVRIGHHLPADPHAAYSFVTGLSNSLEAKIAGRGIVGNNLAARLLAVQADALYARVLFLFLGLPGAILAMLLTISVTSSGRQHLLKEQALLRTRGASTGQVLKFESLESCIIAAGGVALSVLLILFIGRVLTPMPIFTNGTTLIWFAAAAMVGILIAVGSVMYPAWSLAHRATVASSRGQERTKRDPLWRKTYVDILLLALAGFIYWRTSSSGYQVVLAPEGVPQISVHYEAFLAPFCLWLGGVLFAIRLLEFGLMRGRRLLSKIVAPLARNLSDAVAASMGRQRTLITRGAVLVALAVSFAVSTSIFNATYNAQSRVDAELTNGADVTVAGSSLAPPDGLLGDIRSVPGVASAEPVIHRFAYVGNDLQDIYGIDPAKIGEATAMSNAYFENGNAEKTLAMLGAYPDGALVSEETRNDYQLHIGDPLRLRLQFADDHQYHIVPFRFIGVVREFPSAPKDSFLVVNAGYIEQATGTAANETILIRAQANADSAAIAARVKAIVASLPGVRVTDIGSTQRLISSSLTSMDLHGLTDIELVFSILLVVGASGLILGLGLNERRRNFAVLEALGAKRRQLGAFIWSEELLVLACGLFLGLLLGLGIAHILVTVLQGVFDPPPENLVLPWVYLVALLTAAVLSTVTAALTAMRIARGRVVEELRKL